MNLAYLQNVPVFADLAEEDLAIIGQVTIERQYKRGSTVFDEGEAGEGFHYVKSGKVKIVKFSSDGREHIMNILGPNEVFAEVLLFNKGPYPATAIAVEDSYVGMIRNSDLERVILDHPRVAVHIIQIMSRKLLYVQSKVKALAFSDSVAKIAQILDNLLERYGKAKGKGLEIDFDITRNDVANLAGTTRETVSRVLSAMKRDQVLGGDERRIIVLNRQGLRQYYEEKF